MIVVTTMNKHCETCGGTGMKILHKQGNIVADTVYNEFCKTIYASTLYAICDCSIILAKPVTWPAPLVSTPCEII